MTKCPSCGTLFDVGDYAGLSSHFYQLAERSDVAHVTWLNRNITKKKSNMETLGKLLAGYFNVQDLGLNKWIKLRFIEKFFGPRAHPFVIALQQPSRSTLLGYVIEHQHFLRQWVRSCSYIVAKTDRPDVVLYELDNINTEFGGFDKPSHYELLLRMGESLGLDRKKVLEIEPLPDTKSAIKIWNEIAEKDHWLEAMAAMHSLELISNFNLRSEGASLGYFDPSVFKSGATTATKEFLREGYDADVQHSERALELISKYSSELGMIENVQGSFLKSIDAFDRYLHARLQRAKQFEDL